jgi:FixJ family two-component response regulator
MNGTKGTIFIVDDEQALRKALERLLTAAGYRVRSFASAEQYIEDEDRVEPGCLLLDVGLPGLSGIELQQSLFGSPHTRPIVFLTGTGDIQAGVNAMKAGAVDFLTKPISKQLLFAAIEEAFRRDTTHRRDRAVREAIALRFSQLTARERDTLTHVVRGKLNKQIAWEFGIVEKTVKIHRARMMHKMQARSVAELVHLAERVGIAIEPTLSGREWAIDWKPVIHNHDRSLAAG